MQDLESCINDEIVPSQLHSKATTDYNMQGACFESKRELKIEEIKSKNLLKVSNFREFLYTQLKPNYQIFLLVKRT